MLTHVEFRSDVFPAFEDEQRLINPDRWGKRLADFLAYGLREHGLDTGEPIAEDWGWVVPVTNKSFPLWVGCGNYQEYPNGYLCFIEPHKPVVWRVFRRVDTRERVAALQSAIDILLSKHPGVSEKRWWTYEDFNGPRR